MCIIAISLQQKTSKVCAGGGIFYKHYHRHHYHHLRCSASHKRFVKDETTPGVSTVTTGEVYTGQASLATVTAGESLFHGGSDRFQLYRLLMSSFSPSCAVDGGGGTVNCASPIHWVVH